MKCMMIGVAGGTGSGKTTLTTRLKECFGDNLCVISYDSYYLPHTGMSYEERCALNYDHPSAFDTELFLQHLEALKNGESIACPVYDFKEHDRSNETVLISPAPIVVLEGILLLTDPRIRAYLDAKIFVDTDADVRVLRRVVRDVNKRGRTMESVIAQYLTTVKPMHEQFVEPSKRYADVIVPEGGKNAVALDLLVRRLEHHLAQQLNDEDEQGERE